MKLVFLLLVCSFGTILCETHDQQIEYANELIGDIEDAAEDIHDLLEDTNQHTELGKNMILMHANSLNFNVNFAVDCLQHVVNKNEKHSAALQQIVLKLNDISNDLQKSFKRQITLVKLQLRSSVNKIVKEAKNLRNIIRENSDLLYTATLLRFLDDLVTATEKVDIRGYIQPMPKYFLKTFIRISSLEVAAMLPMLNSTDINVYNDIFRYSSKVSSSISENGNLLKDLVFTYNTTKSDEVKEIIYSLGKIAQDNEEVLYNAKSLKEIKQQLGVTIVNLGGQLTKLVDAGFCNDGNSYSKDENLLFIVLPELIADGVKLQKNFARTYINYIYPSDNFNN